MSSNVKLLVGVALGALLAAAGPAVAQAVVEATQGAPGQKGGWIIQGWAAVGSALKGNPVPVAGVDSTGKARTMLTRTDGAPIVTVHPMMPGTAIAKAISAGGADAVTGLTAGSVVDVSCYSDCNFVAGTGTPVATGADNPIWARQTRRLALQATQTAIGFYCSAATTCQVSPVPMGP